MALIWRISILYFLSIFAAGFALGTLRVFVLVPTLGERNAELVEIPVMAILCAVVARLLVARYRDGLRPALALFSGLLALAMMLAVEFTVVLSLRELTVEEYFASRDPAAGVAYLMGLVWFAIAPWCFSVTALKKEK